MDAQPHPDLFLRRSLPFRGSARPARPLWLAGTPAVAEFDLSRAGTMGVRLLSRSGRPPGGVRECRHARRPRDAGPIPCGASTMTPRRHHAAMASDPDMAPLLERFGALRIVRAPDLYEALLVAVIGQQVSVQAAQSIRRRLMRNLGTRSRWASPPAGRIIISTLPRGN